MTLPSPSSEPQPFLVPTPMVPVVATAAAAHVAMPAWPFYQVLLEQLREGIVFVDQNLKITLWNACLENLTGMSSSSMLGRTLAPHLFQLRELDGAPLQGSGNPFADWMAVEGPSQGSYLSAGRSGRETQFEFHCYPVESASGQRLGAVFIVLDRSIQVELQRQLDQLYSQEVVDPLTQVANRAEFERLLVDYVQTHKEVGLKCSVIVCDLDYFKRINDRYGHHIGDQALVTFAQLLKHFVRTQDFVARFGGEEFVILCANCDERAACERAEEIRRALESMPQPMLEQKTMTASFGVAELQIGDTGQSLFVRADQALLLAKESGRNCVVAAGNRASETSEPGDQQALTGETRQEGVWPDRQLPLPVLCDGMYGTNCPSSFVMRKITALCQQFAVGKPSATEHWISFVVPASLGSSSGPATFRVEMDVAPINRLPAGMRAPAKALTLIRIAILPARSGWFRKARREQARELLTEIRGFLSLIGGEHEVLPTVIEPERNADDRYRGGRST